MSVSLPKKVIAVVLALSLLCSSFRFATGQNLFIQEAEAVEPVSSVILGSAAGGSSAILSAAVPLVGLLVFTGLVVSDPDYFANLVMEIWHDLSAASQLELSNAADAESFIPSFSLRQELKELLATKYYDGQIPSLSFDSSELLVYNYLGQSVYSNESYPSIYETVLNTGGWSFIAGTTLAARIVSSPWEDGKNALAVRNTATGVEMVMSNADVDQVLNGYSDGTVRISRPIIREFPPESYGYGHRLGFWLMTECPDLASCSEHTHKYYSYYVGENDNLASNPLRLSITGTGISVLDNQLIAGQTYSEDMWVMWNEDMSQSFPLALSSLSFLMADRVYVQSLAPTLDIPDEDDRVYIPTAEALENTKALTQEGAKTGEWAPAEEGTDATFWERLWSFLQSIIDAILSIPQMIVDGILEGLKFLFIPAEGFFDTFFSDLQATFEDRFGILTYPVSVIFNFFNALLEVDEVEPVLSWNSWSYEGVEVIEKGSYNLNDILDESDTLRTIHNIYLVVVDAFLIFAFLGYVKKKYNSIVHN